MTPGDHGTQNTYESSTPPEQQRTLGAHAWPDEEDGHHEGAAEDSTDTASDTDPAASDDDGSATQPGFVQQDYYPQAGQAPQQTPSWQPAQPTPSWQSDQSTPSWQPGQSWQSDQAPAAAQPAPQYPIPPQHQHVSDSPDDTTGSQADPQGDQAAPENRYPVQNQYPTQHPAQPYPPQQPYPSQQPYPAQQQYGGEQYPAQQYDQGGAVQQYAPNGAVQQYAQTQAVQPGFAPPPQQPAPIPRPEDLLVPDRSPVTAEPASWGWRGRMNRMTGGLVKPKAAEREIALRQAITDIQRSFSRPMTIVVVQPKGGAGKTPTTICLSAAFGAHRGGYVVGWDDNETRGTLAVRVSNPDSKQATVWDLLSDLPAFERYDARVGDLSYYVRSQPDAHFDALVSDDNPGNMAQIGEDEFRRLHTVLQRFYRLIVVDTGNNVRSPNWQAAVNAADLVVVTSTYRRDVGYSGSWVLDHLAQTGREDLARNAVTVLTAADPTVDKTVRGQLLEHFGNRTRAVCEIPYDPELAHGGPIRWAALAPETRNGWILAGATVANALAEHDQRALSERRA